MRRQKKKPSAGYGSRKHRSDRAQLSLDLEQSGLKLQRAQSQIFELRGLVARFVDEVEYKTAVEGDSVRNRRNETTYSFAVEASLEPDPAISAVIGDIFNNLRSSLNYIAFLGVAAGKGEPGRPDFPVRRRKLINTPTQAPMHSAKLRCSSVEWPAIRPSRALLEEHLVTRVGVFINLRRLS